MKNILKSLGYLLYYIFFQVLVLMVFSIILSLSGNIASESEMMVRIVDNMLLVTIISNLLSVLILALFFKIRKKRFVQEVSLAVVKGSEYILPVIGAFCFSMFFGLMTCNMQFNNAVQIAQSIRHFSAVIPNMGLVLEGIALLVCAPLAEEVICRGIMITRLRRSFSDAAAIMISAILFGLLHLLAGGTVLVLGAMIIGMICGIAFIRTKSLMPAIAAHMCGNLADFILPALAGMSDAVRYIFAMVCLVICVGCVVMMCRKNE